MRVGWRGSLKRDESGRKRCTKCGEWQAESRFSSHGDTADKLQPVCRSCVIEKQRLGRYGKDQRWFNRTVERQGWVCAICLSPEVTDVNRACVDHDHSCCPGGNSCGECVRGVLCRRCNLMLGHANDSIETLRRAVDYLEEYRLDPATIG